LFCTEPPALTCQNIHVRKVEEAAHDFIFQTYLCFINRVNHKCPIQGEIFDKDIPTLNSHGRSLSDGATSTNFTSDISKCQSPCWLPYNARPHFHLLSIEDLFNWIIHLDTNLVNTYIKGE